MSQKEQTMSNIRRNQLTHLLHSLTSLQLVAPGFLEVEGQWSFDMPSGCVQDLRLARLQQV
eukprot:6134481-Amphidinium_carterae.1